MFYQLDYAAQAAELCGLGATDEELADTRVERSPYARAVGGSVDRVKILRHAGDTDPVYAYYKPQLAPDPETSPLALPRWRPHALPGTASTAG